MENQLTERYIWDLRKPGINKFERARIIKKYLIYHNLSGRGFALKFGFKKSTIQDWLLWNNMTQETYDKLKQNGLTPTQIYRMLRDDKKPDEIKNKTKLDMHMQMTLDLVKSGRISPKYTMDTLRLATDLDIKLRRFIYKLERRLQIKI